MVMDHIVVSYVLHWLTKGQQLSQDFNTVDERMKSPDIMAFLKDFFYLFGYAVL